MPLGPQEANHGTEGFLFCFQPLLSPSVSVTVELKAHSTSPLEDLPALSLLKSLTRVEYLKVGIGYSKRGLRLLLVCVA
jgi:hypothetical protein